MWNTKIFELLSQFCALWHGENNTVDVELFQLLSSTIEQSFEKDVDLVPL